jgi:hypothetical protein
MQSQIIFPLRGRNGRYHKCARWPFSGADPNTVSQHCQIPLSVFSISKVISFKVAVGARLMTRPSDSHRCISEYQVRTSRGWYASTLGRIFLLLSRAWSVRGTFRNFSTVLSLQSNQLWQMTSICHDMHGLLFIARSADYPMAGLRVPSLQRCEVQIRESRESAWAFSSRRTAAVQDCYGADSPDIAPNMSF